MHIDEYQFVLLGSQRKRTNAYKEWFLRGNTLYDAFNKRHICPLLLSEHTTMGLPQTILEILCAQPHNK
jgi:hypothetical protein